MNKFLAWQHGHVVAAVLSRARLCKKDRLKGGLPGMAPYEDKWMSMSAVHVGLILLVESNS